MDSKTMRRAVVSEVRLLRRTVRSNTLSDFSDPKMSELFPDLEITSVEGTLIRYWRKDIMRSDANVLKISLTSERTGDVTKIEIKSPANAINLFLATLCPDFHAESVHLPRTWAHICDALRLAHRYESTIGKRRVIEVIEANVAYPWDIAALEKAYAECKLEVKELARSWALRGYNVADISTAFRGESPSDAFWTECLKLDSAPLDFTFKCILPFVTPPKEFLTSLIIRWQTDLLDPSRHARNIAAIIDAGIKVRAKKGLAAFLSLIIENFDPIAFPPVPNTSSNSAASSSSSSSALQRIRIARGRNTRPALGLTFQ
ncbi:MAG: hypothetical protein KGL39_01115 [Patescibacteria group bacterium]|nr:hypothetical protein [Patescibacteria group bacterium]